MIPPPLPPDEDDRLAALHELCLLDGERDPSLDGLVELAAAVAGAPIAAITLVDREHQWFKASVGLAVPSTTRRVSFCGHAVLQSAPLVVHDATRDPRFADNPLVSGEPFIRAYAGFPLAAPTGYRVGALCVIDRAPRELTAAQLGQLRLLAAQAEALLAARGAAVAARRDRDRYFSVLDDATDLIQGVMADGTISVVNRAWMQVLGYPSPIGMNIFEVIAPDQREHCLGVMQALFQRREPCAFDTTFVAASGERIDVEGRVAARLDQGRVETLGIFRNVTARRLAGLNAARSRLVLERAEATSAIGTYQIVSQRDQILHEDWSRGALALLGFGVTAASVGAILDGLAHDPEQLVRARAALERHHAADEPLVLELTYQRADGQRRHLSWRALAQREAGEVLSRAGVLVDTTHLRELDRLKSEFVSTVSHELRTPLAAIRGALGLLESGMISGAESTEMIGLARANAERLMRLINDILDLDKIADGGIEPRREAVDLAELCEAVRATLLVPVAEARVQLVLEVGRLSVLGDRDRLFQVLTNFIANAIKYSPPGGRVVVRARPGARSRVRVEVSDEGPGIAADQHTRIFERFYQVDGSDRRRRGGTGLGLAICRAIIEAHRGEIGVASQVGKGSTFWFEIARAASTDSGLGTIADLTRNSVVLAAADARRITTLRGRLGRTGYRLLTFEDLAAVEAMISEVEVAAVLTSQAEWPALPDAGARLAALRRRVIIIDPEDPALEAKLRMVFRPPGLARVLVVEDDAVAGQLLTTLVERLGAEVILATSGVAAIEVSRREHFDLVILDTDVPDADGFAVVDQLQQGRLRTVPLLVHAGRALDAAERAMLTLGPTRHLAKGVAPEAVQAAMRELLGPLAARR